LCAFFARLFVSSLFVRVFFFFFSVLFSIIIHHQSDSVHLVEIRRGKGDILEYYKLFNELVTNRINHLINIPAGLELGGPPEVGYK
jgi:hypothetical protein